jgi:site-specific DNA recombinase
MRGVVCFGCSVRMNRRGCDNARNVAANEVESRVLAALRKYLLAPDIIAAAIEAYCEERQRLSREASRERRSLEREYSDTKRKTEALIRAIEEGGDTKLLLPRLKVLGAQKDELEARLVLADSPDVVELYPQAAKRYAGQVTEVQAALSAGDVAGLEAVGLVRDLITRVRVSATPRGRPRGGGRPGSITDRERSATSVMSIGFEPTTGLMFETDGGLRLSVGTALPPGTSPEAKQPVCICPRAGAECAPELPSR